MSARRRAAILMAAAALTTLCLAFGSWSLLQRPYAGWRGDHATVTIEPGMHAGGVLERLAGAGVIRSAGLGRAWLAMTGSAASLQSGEYRFDRAASLPEVLQRIEAGDVLLHAVTLPEGLTFVEIAGRFEESGIAGGQALIDVFSEAGPIADLDPHAEDLEGYLFPDTYRFPRGESPERIRDALLRNFRAAIGPDYAAAASEVGLTLREAVILASMIEEETSLPGERARISGVFHNRLRRGMRMECDPTVIYGIEREGDEVGRLTRSDLDRLTPWNTYRIDGLPKGPIANAGRESLRAAVHPQESREIFFVAAPGGGHRFSTDLAGHNRAVAEWRRHQRSSR